MTVRLAIPADVPAIMQIIKDVVPLMRAAGNLQWDDQYPGPEVFDNDIKNGQLWVADVNGSVAGVAAITTSQEPEYAQAGFDISEPAIVTHRLAVSPHYRGQGIAGALLLQAEHEALYQDIAVLRIDTNTHNTATQKLFPKLGYVYAGEIGLGFRPGLRFYCYEKRLIRI